MMASFQRRLLILLQPLIFTLAAHGQIISLQPYAIEAGSLTVSGFSSGGAMATQFHVAFSADINGVGIFSGFPYGCALGSDDQAGVCIRQPEETDLNQLFDRTTEYEKTNVIDSTDNMKRDKVYVLHGTLDTPLGNGPLTEDYYKHYMSNPESDIATEFELEGAHGFPTDNFGGPCEFEDEETGINNCSYPGVFVMLNHLYDGKIVRDKPADVVNNLFLFDQKEFFPNQNPSNVSLDDEGYVYIPTECKKNPNQSHPCKLHVAFHGCEQGLWILGDTYVINTGYLELAESNGIIIIFPQVVPTPDEGLLRGCWNWYGYLGDTDYDTKNGDQMAGVWKMILKMGYVPVDPAGNTGSRQTLSFLVLFLALYRCFSLLL